LKVDFAKLVPFFVVEAAVFIMQFNMTRTSTNYLQFISDNTTSQYLQIWTDL
jgi:hypothetical protein